MSQPAKVQEPSMEEILASIRRIIADDEAKPTAAEKPSAPTVTAEAGKSCCSAGRQGPRTRGRSAPAKGGGTGPASCAPCTSCATGAPSSTCTGS